MSENQVAIVNQELVDLLSQFGIQSEEPAPERVNTLSVKGSKFSYNISGESTTVETIFNGEPMAAPSVNAVILRHVPDSKWDHSHTFYKEGYVEGSNKAPDCYSKHGKKPDSSVKEPQHTDCKTCPQRAKGSRPTADNVDGKACGSKRFLAVVLQEEKTHTPLQLQLSITSLWADPLKEAENRKNGWYPYDEYVEFLKTQGIPKPIMVETAIKFDAKASHPKCLFKFVKQLPEDMLVSKVLPLYNSDPVMKVLGLDREPEAWTTQKQAAVEASAPIAQVESKTAPVEVVPAPAAEAPAPAEKPKKAAPAPKVEEASAEVADQLANWD